MKMVEDEDLMNILAQINHWIDNCDTKSSILLALIGIITGVIFSNKYHSKLISPYFNSPISLSVQFIIYSLILVCSISLILIGISHLILSINPNFKINKENGNSLIFYASIAENSSEEYKNKIKDDDYSLTEDIISQIHINAEICTKKFENYQCGLITSLIGFILLSILILI